MNVYNVPFPLSVVFAPVAPVASAAAAAIAELVELVEPAEPDEVAGPVERPSSFEPVSHDETPCKPEPL